MLDLTWARASAAERLVAGRSSQLAPLERRRRGLCTAFTLRGGRREPLCVAVTFLRSPRGASTGWCGFSKRYRGVWGLSGWIGFSSGERGAVFEERHGGGEAS